MAIIGKPGTQTPIITSFDKLRLQEFLNPERDGKLCAVAVAEPGWTSRDHLHDEDEIVYIIEGELTWDDGQTFRAGDVVIHEANTRYQLKAGPQGAKFIGFGGKVGTVFFDDVTPRV